MPKTKPTAIVAPNLGLYSARPNLAIPDRGLADGMNFRIRLGKLSSTNLGWARLSNFTLDGPVRLIDNFFPKQAGEALIFADNTDIYQYVASGSGSVAYLTPRHETGTIDISAANPATVTFSVPGIDLIIKPGDLLHLGASGYRDPIGPWYEIASVDGPATVTMTTQITSIPLVTQPYTVRLLFTMDDEDWWDSTTFVSAAGVEDLWIAVNGVNYPVSWNGTDTQVTSHPEGNFIAKAVATFKNMAIFANLIYAGDNDATQMVNSDVGEPFNVGDAGTGLSEQFRVHDGEDEILALRPLGDSLVAYSQRHAVPMEFVGDPEVFIFRDGINGYGPIGPGTIAEFSDYHIFLGQDSAYRFDGVNSQETDTHFWPEIIRQQDPARKKRIFCHFTEEFGELLWSFPLTTDPGSGSVGATATQAQVTQYLEEVPQGIPTPYSRRQFPFSAAGYFSRQTALRWDELTLPWASYNFRWNDQSLSAKYPFTLVGDVEGKVYILNGVQSGAGEVLTNFIRTGRRVVVDGRVRGVIKRVYPFVDQSSGVLEVTTRMADFVGKPATIIHTDAFDMALPPERHFTNPYRRGRFVEVEFGSEGAAWEISGYDLDANTGGRR